jgi:hypothetical protein
MTATVVACGWLPSYRDDDGLGEGIVVGVVPGTTT